MNRPQPLPVEKLEINRSLLKMVKMSNGGGNFVRKYFSHSNNFCNFVGKTGRK